MIQALAKNGFTITGSESDADIVVINTCGFLEPAKLESMSTIQDFAKKKQSGKLRGLVVAGCMTERYLEPMQKKFPEVDAFIRTGEFSKILPAVESIEKSNQIARLELIGGEDKIPQLQGHSEIANFVERLVQPRAYAYVKISEGCNRVCSFCIIPKLRGRHHSRSIEGIVDEVRQLVEMGVQEIVFIAQDLTSYGRDLGNGSSLAGLLTEVEKVEGLYWYRLMYNYPRFFDDELISVLAASEKFSGYLDIPFQHISDSVLRGMKRPETSDEIRSLIEKLKASLPRLSLRTTLMVGFPGETERDFSQLLEFLKFANFQHMGAFTYYREIGTPSYDLENQISEEVKKERYSRLMEAQSSIQSAWLEQQIGKEAEVVIDAEAQKIRGGYLYCGRTWAQAPEVDGITYVQSPERLEVGDIVVVKTLERAGDYDLLSEVLFEAEALPGI